MPLSLKLIIISMYLHLSDPTQILPHFLYIWPRNYGFNEVLEIEMLIWFICYRTKPLKTRTKTHVDLLELKRFCKIRIKGLTGDRLQYQTQTIDNSGAVSGEKWSI